MPYYKQLYLSKDDPKVVQQHLADFLLFQIYSPMILHYASSQWTALPWFIKENVPEDIQILISKCSHAHDQQLQNQINKYYIQQAVNTLSAYQTCDVPITQDTTVPTNRYKLTSKQGDKALGILQHALTTQYFSDQMAELAVRTGHKFLMDDKYYVRFKISAKGAYALTKQSESPIGNNFCYIFPTIQLTKGCTNHCSHCDSRAKSHLSHMPWPIFHNLYRELHKYYKNYPQNLLDCYFCKFFADSDMLDYHDPIMNVDSGDVGLWIDEEKGICQYLTRGVKNQRNRLALAKAVISGQPLAFSFVDIPQENRQRNLKLLNDSLDTVKSVGKDKQARIVHIHLKNGPFTTDPSIFRDFPVSSTIVHSLGRAKDLPFNEIEHFPDEKYIASVLIEPNGNITNQTIKNGEITQTKLTNIFRYNHGPKIGPIRLFIRQHILPHI